MKRTMAIMLVTLLLLTTIISVSAQNYTFPVLPNSDYSNYIIYNNNGSYRLLFNNGEIDDDEQQIMLYPISAYDLLGDSWVKDDEVTGLIAQFVVVDTIIYDSTGTINTGNTITFVYPKVIYDDFSNVLVSMTDQINVTTVIGIIVFIIGIVVGLAFLYWGIRKVVRAIMAAFKKGKISL